MDVMVTKMKLSQSHITTLVPFVPRYRLATFPFLFFPSFILSCSSGRIRTSSLSSRYIRTNRHHQWAKAGFIESSSLANAWLSMSYSMVFTSSSLPMGGIVRSACRFNLTISCLPITHTGHKSQTCRPQHPRVFRMDLPWCWSRTCV